MDKLKHEQESEDRIEQQEHEDCNQDHSSTGLCPCCGVELENHSHDMWVGDAISDTIEQSQQICPSCGWFSTYFYDG